MFAFNPSALSWMGGNPHMEMTARELRETVEMAFNRFLFSLFVCSLSLSLRENVEIALN